MVWWLRWLRALLAFFGWRPRAIGVRFLVDGKDVTTMLLTIDQKVGLRIQPVDRSGNPAPVDGVPAWTTSNPAVGTLTPSADGLSAEFVTTALGLTQVAVSADADLGAGVRTIAGTLDIQVEGGEAVALAVLAGAPEPK